MAVLQFISDVFFTCTSILKHCHIVVGFLTELFSLDLTNPLETEILYILWLLRASYILVTFTISGKAGVWI
jgi:hypothetical protein